MQGLLSTLNCTEFFPMEALAPSGQAFSDNIRHSNRGSFLSEDEDESSQSVYMHVLNMVRAFFKKRMLNGKSLFNVLAKQFSIEDSRFKTFELIFVVAFFSKDLPSDIDFYYKAQKPLNIFNNCVN
mmetsp:Transcript_46880/g.34315  ORF Transcript_46880/g.34315 Transcript_46880/m.34315 type:complete len:126 (-) Transcript_46880:765-1142(-)